MRKFFNFTIDRNSFFLKLLNFLRNEEIFIIFDSNRYPYHTFECLAVWGVTKKICYSNENLFEKLFNFHRECNDWLFGHISYDVKNYIEDLKSNNPDYIGFPDIFFFQPVYMLQLTGNVAQYYVNDELAETVQKIHKQIERTKIIYRSTQTSYVFHGRMSREFYLEQLKKIKTHIQKGDIYEMNFCQEFYAENIEADPFQIFLNIKEHHPMPFSAFYRLGEKFLLCASPERYIRKEGQTIISQPIKGTIKRGIGKQDDKLKYQQLFKSEKDRAENIMIVDLVRNDLSRTALPSSVLVEELCGIYSFPGVYQMISTVKSTMRQDVTFADVIKTTFPMGSMTGAPKIRAMQLIEQYEVTRRGLYSGCVGYINPEADFDFNVVIRSLQYNASTKYASIITGGAITAYSKPLEEYNECLIKANGLLKAIDSTIEV